MAGAKRSKDDAAARHRRAGTSGSSVEAVQLITAMREDLAVLQSFLDSEEKAASGRGVSPKRVARLRLISDDLRSARRFVAKSVKG